MLETEQLKQFVVVAECQSLTAAAGKLFISHSSLSRSIQRMEKELGVQLFDRSRNRLALNKNGELALRGARRILDDLAALEEQIRQNDRKTHTISVGSCAPGPLWFLLPVISTVWPEKSVSSELCIGEKLNEKLLDGTYQLIVTGEPPDSPETHSQFWRKERLYFSLPPRHPKAKAKSLSYSDLDGETMVMFRDIGCWSFVQDYMPHSHFIIQENLLELREIVDSSTLPSFFTDLCEQYFGMQQSRVMIPIDDEKSVASFYCVCLKSNLPLFTEVFRYLP